VLSWRSSAAEVLAATGARESATRLVEAEVALCRQAGTASVLGRPSSLDRPVALSRPSLPSRGSVLGRPSALGRALRVQGRVLGAPDGVPVLEEAVRVLAGSPRRFEYARALVDWGELLNAVRRKPQARRVLREGLELARRCGSPALSDRATTAYAAAGGKVRPLAASP
jgi:hypothetical protein